MTVAATSSDDPYAAPVHLTEPGIDETGRVRRWRRVAPYVVAGLWMVFGVSSTALVGWSDALLDIEHDPRYMVLAVTDVLVGAVAFVLLFFRRRRPLGVALTVTVIASFLSGTAVGSMIVALISYASRPVEKGRRRRRWVLFGLFAVIAAVGGAVLTVVTEHLVRQATAADPALLEARSGLSSRTDLVVAAVVFAVLVVGFSLAVGSYMGARRALLAELRERAVRAESMIEVSSDRARTAERNRIAREMHDVLAHRISLVALHAGALSHRTDLPPEDVREAAGVITSNAQLALVELRQVLGVLRADGEEVDGTGHREPPQPTLASLDQLLGDARAVGTRVRLSVIGIGSVPGDPSGAVLEGTGVDDTLATVSPTVSRTAYRIVQEALTNARKHAPDAVVDLELSGRLGRVLTVAVTNPMPFAGAVAQRTAGADGGGTGARAQGAGAGATWAAGAGAGARAGGAGIVGSGNGLTGLAERTDLAGGTLDHGVEPDGFGRTVFAVRAWLPWDESVGGGRRRTEG